MDLPCTMTVIDNNIDYIHWDEIVNRLQLLEVSHQADHNGHDNKILSINEELREAVDYKLTSFYTRRSVEIAIPINQFGLSFGGGSESYY